MQRNRQILEDEIMLTLSGESFSKMLKDYETYDTVTLSLIANERELMDRFNIGDVIDNETLVEYYNK